MKYSIISGHWESKEPGPKEPSQRILAEGASAKNLNNMKMAKEAWAKGA